MTWSNVFPSLSSVYPTVSSPHGDDVAASCSWRPWVTLAHGLSGSRPTVDPSGLSPRAHTAGLTR